MTSLIKIQNCNPKPLNLREATLFVIKRLNSKTTGCQLILFICTYIYVGKRSFIGVEILKGDID
jgi:hypothetical protein